jgi:hypothetical protein
VDIAKAREDAEYALSQGGYHVNPVPLAHTVLALVKEIEQLHDLVAGNLASAEKLESLLYEDKKHRGDL